MDKPVLFATGLGKDIARAENIVELFEAYPGDKRIMSAHDNSFVREATSGQYGLLVIDVFPTFKACRTIMIWHAIQGGKYIGLDQSGTYYRPYMADFIDYIVTAGRGGTEMFHRCTGVPEDRIMALGMPRTDRYIGKRKGAGGTELAGKRAYLYVPTFRRVVEPQIPPVEWDYLDEALADDELLVVKPHPYGTPFRLGKYKHIIEADRMLPSVNYLYDCDVVITDYSSIMFDGYLLGKPCVLFEKKPGYVSTRGMYLKYPEEYSSRYVTNELALMMKLREARGLTKTERNVADYVAGACDGHSCERITRLIREVKL